MKNILIVALFMLFFALITTIALKFSKKDDELIYNTAIMLCELDYALANSCQSISMQDMKYRHGNEKYWQKAKELIDDEAKVLELKEKLIKIKEFNEQVVKFEKQKLEQQQRQELLAKIKKEFNQKAN